MGVGHSDLALKDLGDGNLREATAALMGGKEDTLEADTMGGGDGGDGA